MKKKLATLFLGTSLVLAAAACEVKETKEGSYQVETPTASETAATTAEVSQDAKEAASDAKEAGRDAMHETGTAVEETGKEMQEHAKPGDQK